MTHETDIMRISTISDVLKDFGNDLHVLNNRWGICGAKVLSISLDFSVEINHTVVL